MKGKSLIKCASSAALALSMVLPATASCSLYPFAAPSVLCRSNLAWLREAMPDVSLSIERDASQGTYGSDMFLPTDTRTLTPTLWVWRRLQQTRFCNLAESLRHNTA